MLGKRSTIEAATIFLPMRGLIEIALWPSGRVVMILIINHLANYISGVAIGPTKS
jgi:hypothetical protein